MAKINAYGNHQVGPTYFTERDFGRPGLTVNEVIYEAWRVRSDRMLQSRIVSVTDVDTGRTRKHNSAFRNLGTLNQRGLSANQADLLRDFIDRRVRSGYFRVVKTR